MDLQKLTDGLKQAGVAFVAMVWRYMPETVFSTRISFPDGQTDLGDKMLRMAIAELASQPRNYPVADGSMVESVRNLRQLEGEGWNFALFVHNSLINSSRGRLYISDRLHPEPSPNHIILDVIREIVVEWSNINHTG